MLPDSNLISFLLVDEGDIAACRLSVFWWNFLKSFKLTVTSTGILTCSSFS